MLKDKGKQKNNIIFHMGLNLKDLRTIKLNYAFYYIKWELV